MKDTELIKIVPSARQVAFQELEFYAFVHFTVNTFTGREWGEGNEDPAIFNPVELNADEWVESIKSAGMRGLILTCKHHDGFCLWPSKYTKHSVEYSPYKNGKGNVVGEVAEACKKGGIKFGVYLSPWDRNNALYGTGKPYNDYFVSQLEELLSDYGEVFSVWFDGACGEGPNGKVQVYDWERYYEVIRRLQPNACINVCGPDIRWCGNEAGETRESEWSVVPARTRDTEKIKEASQHEDNEEFRNRTIKATDQDLGSRSILENETELCWYPAEVNTSIRGGWFYHTIDDAGVKTIEKLTDIYFKSVGGNATFLLNIPPMPSGKFNEIDNTRLKELGEYLRSAFAENLTKTAKLSASHSRTGHSIDKALRDSYDEWFMTEDGEQECDICAEFENGTEVKYIVLKENINLSQRIEKFSIHGDGKFISSHTIVGHKKIVKLDSPVKVKKLTVKIEDSRVCPTLSFIGIY